MTPIQFNAMVLDSYNTLKVEDENSMNKEFMFPLNQEIELEVAQMFTYHNENRNTYNLCNQKEPLMDCIPPRSHPMPLDSSKRNNPMSPQAPFEGVHPFNNPPTMLRNLA